MKVLALTKYGTLAASTRQRFLQYEPAFEEAGIELECSPLLDNDYLADVLAGRPPSAGSIIRAYRRRWLSIRDARSADVIWLHCEFLPYWPAVAEIIAARMTARPIVFDFDDAIFHMYDENGSLPVRLLLRDKLVPLLRRVRACTCGNAYLRDYAAAYCANSIVVPTVVDTDKYKPAERRDDRRGLVIGWIGSPSTWRNVQPMLPMLREVCAETGATLLAVGAGAAARGDHFPGLELRDWGEDSEIGDVQSMDIGIMPLVDRPFERGKSGYKLVQYMACGLPVVASPVGVNSEIVENGENGFLARDEHEWRDVLIRLLRDENMRKELGASGRARAQERYSLASQSPRLVDLFKTIAGVTPR